jgi:beta-mannosidase
VVWNGNNENIWLHDADGWAAELGDRGWGLDYYLDLLPTIVDAVDPTRFYTVASPWSGNETIPANDVDLETHHSWDVWNRLGDEHYRDSVPRFVSEFGWQAPPQWRTMRDAVSDEPMTPTSPGVVHHQKAADGMGKLARGLEPRFPSAFSADADGFDRWHYLTQLQQSRAIATGVEHWRTHWPRNTGVVVWQLNDLWSVSSWSAVDGAGREKPLFHELRRLYDDVLLTIRPVSTVDTTTGGARPADGQSRSGGTAPATASLPVQQAAGSGVLPEPSFDDADAEAPSSDLHRPTTDEEALGDLADTAVLDGSSPARGSEPVPIEIAVRSARRSLSTSVRVRRIDLSGAILAEETLPVQLDRPGVAVVRIPRSVGVVSDEAGELVVADMDWRRAVWSPLPDREMRWQPAQYSASVAPDGAAVMLTVRATSLVRDLLVQPDRLSATGRVDRGFMTLLPGEAVEFRIDGVHAGDAERLVRAPVLRSLDRVLAD